MAGETLEEEEKTEDKGLGSRRLLGFMSSYNEPPAIQDSESFSKLLPIGKEQR